MAHGLRDRFFRSLARIGVVHPWRLLIALLVVTAGAAALIPGLHVSTSRTGLVSGEDPQQARMNAFYERFGRPDAPLFVIDGGTPDQRRAVVDRLEASLEADPRFEGRVLGRVGPDDIAPILLLQRPEALAGLARSMEPEQLRGLVSGGLEAWLGAMAEGIEAGLSGETQAEVKPEQLSEQLGQLAMIGGALDDYLAGRDPMKRLAAKQADAPGMDEAGYLVTASGNEHLVSVFPDLETDEGRELQPIVQELRAHRDQALEGAPQDVRADLTGLPALAADELTIVEQGLRTSSIAATLGILVLCLALFRSLKLTIVALVPLLPGIVLTLGTVRLLYQDLNLVTSSFVAVLLGLGIDFSVHLIARYNEAGREGESVESAIETSMVRSGPGVGTGALVTAAAFLTTATTDFTAYAELGLITAVGLVIIVVVTFTLLPPLLRIGGRKNGPLEAAPEPPGIGVVVSMVRRWKWPLVVVAAVAGILGGLALPRIDYNPRYFDFLPETTESARALSKLEYDPIASPVFAVLTADSIEDARTIAESLRQLETVAGVQTPSDLLPELTEERKAALRAGLSAFGNPDFEALSRAPLTRERLAPRVLEVADALDAVRFELSRAGLPSESAAAAQEAFSNLHDRLTDLDEEGRARLAALHPALSDVAAPAWETATRVLERGHYEPTDLPMVFQRRYVSKDGDALAIFAVPAGQFWEVEVANAFSEDIRGVDPEAVGLALVHVTHNEMIKGGFERAAGIAALVVVIMLLIDLRSLKDALLALLPTILGWLWMLGLMAALGIEFNIANIVALPLVIGIGIAFGVHTMHRCREVSKGQPGRLDEIVRGTGGAIAVAALTTMVGFAGLVLVKYGAMQSLGLTMVLGIASCLVATVLVLPAVLLLLERAT